MRKLIEFTSKNWNELSFQIKYKKAIFILETNSLKQHNIDLLNAHDSSEYNISGTALLVRGTIDPSSISLTFNSYGIPQKLSEYEIKQTTYITYKYWHDHGMKYPKIQRNGFLVYCAPTGQGKTYFALNNIEGLSEQFDTILYINLELSIDDIKNRCLEMDINIPDNLYVAPLDNVRVIEEWAANKGRCMFIVDNIDNLVGGGFDPFGEQLDFIKGLDRFLKDYGHHALVLTQLVKENNMNLLGKDGEINDGITTNILSGVKQLSYLSRSVLMTAYSSELASYVYKFLKVGSAKLW